MPAAGLQARHEWTLYVASRGFCGRVSSESSRLRRDIVHCTVCGPSIQNVPVLYDMYFRTIHALCIYTYTNNREREARAFQPGLTNPESVTNKDAVSFVL
jgi:hypothetical protein